MLFTEAFSDAPSKEEVVTYFLAVLELLKLGQMHILQGSIYGEIELIAGKAPYVELPEEKPEGKPKGRKRRKAEANGEEDGPAAFGKNDPEGFSLPKDSTDHTSLDETGLLISSADE